MEEQDHIGSAQIVQDLAFVAAKPELVSFTDAVRLVKERGKEGEFTYKAWNLEQYLAAPLRTREKVDLQDSLSFIQYLEDFGTAEGTRVFFDNDAAAFLAVIDNPTKDKPSWGDHVATWKLRHSEEWNLWFGRNAKPFGQVGFGRFIEENMIDVIKPDGATLLEMVMTFEATKNVQFREANRLKNGQVQFLYSEEIKTGNVDIPDVMTISIPVFYNQAPRPIDLRFRYKIEDGKLALWHEFVRPQRIINEASAELVQQVRAAGFPVHMGKRLPRG